MDWVEQWLATWKGLLSNDAPRLAMVAGMFLLLTLVETSRPAEKGQRLGGRSRNLVFAVLFTILGTATWSILLPSVGARLPFRPSDDLGASLLRVLLYLMVSDFIYYWYHRAQHRFAFLWTIHELHHADTQLNVTTSLRTYWLELPVQALLIGAPTFLLVGIDPTGATIFAFTATVILLFSHWNVPLRLGPFSRVLVGPQVHRVHHSKLAKHQDKNFAQVFPIYDVLFGTYWAPQRDEFPPTGTRELASDASPATVLARPFRQWAGAMRRSS